MAVETSVPVLEEDRPEYAAKREELREHGIRYVLASAPFLVKVFCTNRDTEFVFEFRAHERETCFRLAGGRGLLRLREIGVERGEEVRRVKEGEKLKRILHGLAGAALDCFAQEPVTSPHRFGKLENVLLAPHSIAWTHELFRDIGAMASQSMIDLAHGRRPHGVINPEVFDHPAFQEKWNRLKVAS